MKRHLIQAALLCAVVALVGCGGSSGGGETVDPPVASDGLLRAASADELERSLKAALATPGGSVDLSLAPGSGSPGGGFSGTYTLEARVDEADTVRYDGQHLFVAPQRFMSCCFVAADLLPPEPPAVADRSIRILATDAAAASARQVGTIPLEDEVSVQGLYPLDGRLFALTGQAYYGGFGPFWSDIAVWAPERSGFRIYDVEDPAAPRLLADATMDGVLVDSRRIGDTVYLVSRYTPGLPTLQLPVLDAAQAAANRQALDAMSLDDLLPQLSLGGVERPLVAAEQCYLSADSDGGGYPVITTITAIPLGQPEQFRSVCYDDDAYGLYVSEDAIYLTQLRFAAGASSAGTRIHKFALADGAVAYRGSIDIEGQVWSGGQNDFRLSERAGVLRVFASVYGGSSGRSVEHRLYMIRESAGGAALELAAQLPNARRPEAIGKPDEALYGVRFLDDRAYAVTFRQVDPLYAIDLADPADPFLAGQLEVTGFSDFLHPVSDGLLLGLGADAGGGVKLELFDVSDLSRPQSRGSQVLGGAGSYSEARYDRHAFAYLAGGGGPGIDRLAIPASVTSPDAVDAAIGSGLYLFEIHATDRPAEASLRAAGALLPPPPQGFGGVNRAFLHEGSVFFVRDAEVWSALWATPEAAHGPF